MPVPSAVAAVSGDPISTLWRLSACLFLLAVLGGCNPHVAASLATNFAIGAMKGAAEASATSNRRIKPGVYMKYMHYPEDLEVKFVSNAEGAVCRRVLPHTAYEEDLEWWRKNKIFDTILVNKHSLVDTFECDAPGYHPTNITLVGLRIDALYSGLDPLTAFPNVTSEPVDIVLIRERYLDANELERDLERRRASLDARVSEWRKAYRDEYHCEQGDTDLTCREFEQAVESAKNQSQEASDSERAAALRAMKNS